MFKLAWWFDPKKLIHHCTTIFCTRGMNMHYQKRLTRKNGEDGVSPVVGVMLMLVVTIIIAAVVSGFAGGLIGSTEKPPTLSMDVRVANSGSAQASGFTATVLSSSGAIPTKDLRIVTSWQTVIQNNVTNPKLITGQMGAGGNTSTGNVLNVNTYVGMQTKALTSAAAPFGMGAGIADASKGNSYGQNPTDPFGAGTRQWQYWGNYSLVAGTGLYALPAPYDDGTAIGGVAGHMNTTGLVGGYGVTTKYTYLSAGSYTYPGQIDATSAVLGCGWENLRPGDVVSVKIIHIPSGKAIFSKEVTVTEG
jgi:archaeal type IV pilus assembly protein PilA